MIASLPPISATTRLIQIWPFCGLAASSLMCRPTSRDPVKETNRVFGCATRRSPIAPPLPVRKQNECGGKPASSSVSANIAAMVGVSLEGLMTTVLPVTSAAHRHAAQNRQREIPRRNHDADAQRQIAHLIALAGKLHHGLRTGQAQHLARIIFAEVDGLGDFRFRFRPGLARFEHQPGVEFELALADQRGRFQEHSDTILRPASGSIRRNSGTRFRPPGWPVPGSPSDESRRSHPAAPG